MPRKRKPVRPFRFFNSSEVTRLVVMMKPASSESLFLAKYLVDPNLRCRASIQMTLPDN